MPVNAKTAKRPKAAPAHPTPVASIPGRRLRHRVMSAGEVVFGPGKADVLAGIEETGSLSATARGMGMSYMRAWRLIQEMHAVYAAPLVELHRGGKGKGGANLTAAGRQALALYRRMEVEALAATEPAWREFCRLLKPAHRAAPR